ncbi:MAG: hypothetical protein JSS76_10025 [Bacteroidetes bacterium]|nr:hypothetical protein [Bacteroidota bacterium]
MYQISALIGLCMLYITTASAQYGCKTTSKGDTIYQRCYYTTGALCTEISYLKNNERWKQVKIYTKSKELVYERSYGQRYGSSHVELRYQPSGSVSTAHYTMQPDGGIQYTDITTYFKPDGSIDHEEDMSRGNDGEIHPWPIHMPDKPQPVVPAPRPVPAPAPAACLPVPEQRELYLINYTSERLHLICQYRDIKAASMSLLIEPADTAKVGVYSSFHTSPDPLQHYMIQIADKARRGYQYQVKTISNAADTQQYIMIVYRKIKGRK